MSGLDQPLLVANSNYHVGQQTSIRVAEEQGFFHEEGFENYVYACRGLLPGPLEREGLALVMKEQGVDIATAVDVGSVLWQRTQEADAYVVGGWRYPPNFKVFGGKHVESLAGLRGRRIGTREHGGLSQLFIANGLRKIGVDPWAEVEWVYDPIFSYGNDPTHLDWLRDGRIDAMTTQPPYTEHARREGFPLLLDPLQEYPGGRPDKVIVATGRVIEHRAAELTAFLRANIRGFRYMRDPANLAALQDLEERYRAASHNDDERKLRIVTSVEKTEGWNVPITGSVSRPALEQVIEELTTSGELQGPLTIDAVLRDEFARAAYEDVSTRPSLQAAHQQALAAVDKYGF